MLTGDRVLYLVRLRNSDLVTANIQVGSTLAAVHTSIGKLLLAYLDRSRLDARVTDASFAANHGPNAKVSLAELRAELAKIREDGWAMQDEELAFGLRSVAAPVHDATARSSPARTSPCSPATGRPSASSASSSRWSCAVRGDLRPARLTPDEPRDDAPTAEARPGELDDEQRALTTRSPAGRARAGRRCSR